MVFEGGAVCCSFHREGGFIDYLLRERVLVFHGIQEGSLIYACSQKENRLVVVVDEGDTRAALCFDKGDTRELLW